MAFGEPVTTAKASVEQILELLQRKLSRPVLDSREHRPYRTSAPSHSVIDRQVEPLDGIGTTMSEATISGTHNSIGPWDQELPQVDWAFDVFTTDLNHFFQTEGVYEAETIASNDAGIQRSFS